MRPAIFFGYITVVVFLSACLAAQGRPTGGNGGRPSTGTTNNSPTIRPGTNIPPPNNLPTMPGMPRVLFLRGKVAVDDGSELTDPAIIESFCNGERHFEAYTDRKGNFSFEFGKQRSIGAGDASTSSSFPGTERTPEQQRRELQHCQLLAVLPGFTSRTVELSTLDMGEYKNVGTIVLHRIGQVQGFTISATTAMAPHQAKKAYEKGRDQEGKKKWDAAAKKFREAVQLYPKFAAAWVELGRVQIEKKDLAGAQQAFERAADADSQFITPHQYLAVFAFRDHRWPEVVKQSEAVLRLNPLSFAQAWYYNSAAHYYLAQYELAEKSARQGIKTDVEHRIPKLEYLLGVILAQERDYQGAAEHMRNYVRLAPQAADVAQVNEQIAKIEKLSSAESSASHK